MLVPIPMILTTTNLYMIKVCYKQLPAMKFSIVITSLVLISSTVTALTLPNEQDLVTRDNHEVEARTPLNFNCLLKCFLHHSADECNKKCA